MTPEIASLAIRRAERWLVTQLATTSVTLSSYAPRITYHALIICRSTVCKMPPLR